jgi:hypothetical protein
MLTLVVNLALPRTVVMAHTGQTSTTPLDRGADKACITYLGLSTMRRLLKLRVSALVGANHSLMANLHEPELKLVWHDKDQGWNCNSWKDRLRVTDLSLEGESFPIMTEYSTVRVSATLKIGRSHRVSKC